MEVSQLSEEVVGIYSTVYGCISSFNALMCSIHGCKYVCHVNVSGNAPRKMYASIKLQLPTKKIPALFDVIYSSSRVHIFNASSIHTTCLITAARAVLSYLRQAVAGKKVHLEIISNLIKLATGDTYL